MTFLEENPVLYYKIIWMLTRMRSGVVRGHRSVLLMGIDGECEREEQQSMEAYTSFARVYDTFMDNILLTKNGVNISPVLCENMVSGMDWYWIWGAVPGT